MRDSYSVRFSTAICTMAFLLVLGGCGYKNSPVPPEAVVPQSIGDLTYKVDENGVKLTWSYPMETIKKELIQDVSSFMLYRAEIPLEDYCGGCPIPFDAPMELAGGSVYDGKLRKKGSYESSLLRSGSKYFFKVRSRTGWWATSADSNIVTFVWFKPAAAPGELKAVAGDRQVSLSWQPVTQLVDGNALDKPLKYQVLRSIGGKDFEKVGELQTGTGFIDMQVRNGQKYFYTVQSIMEHEEELVSGAVSKDVTVMPVDLTPPVAPAGVTAVRTASGIKVFWDRSDATDIGGYKIYRRPADKDDYTLLGEVKPDYTLFVDAKAGESVRYYYAITAFDKATPPNESDKSREATVRY